MTPHAQIVKFLELTEELKELTPQPFTIEEFKKVLGTPCVDEIRVGVKKPSSGNPGWESPLFLYKARIPLTQAEREVKAYILAYESH